MIDIFDILTRVGVYISSFIFLFLAFLSGILGILLFKSIYNDFSLIDISFQQLVLTPLSSTFFITLGVYLGFYAFKKMKGS